MNPLFLATAVEAVIKAGGIQMAFVESGFYRALQPRRYNAREA